MKISKHIIESIKKAYDNDQISYDDLMDIRYEIGELIEDYEDNNLTDEQRLKATSDRAASAMDDMYDAHQACYGEAIPWFTHEISNSKVKIKFGYAVCKDEAADELVKFCKNYNNPNGDESGTY